MTPPAAPFSRTPKGTMGVWTNPGYHQTLNPAYKNAAAVNRAKFSEFCPLQSRWSCPITTPISFALSPNTCNMYFARPWEAWMIVKSFIREYPAPMAALNPAVPNSIRCRRRVESVFSSLAATNFSISALEFAFYPMLITDEVVCLPCPIRGNALPRRRCLSLWRFFRWGMVL